jgi:hypothetical protein
MQQNAAQQQDAIYQTSCEQSQQRSKQRRYSISSSAIC